MSQRDSGYARQERDLYETPAWVTEALLPHIPERIKAVWESACGTGMMARVFLRHDFNVYASDITEGCNFLAQTGKGSVPASMDAIITNPPYERATEFVTHALNLMAYDGVVAMLLRTDFDHAKTRKHLFANHRAFAKKLVLTKRIVWFEPAKASPSFNHAWFIWDWKHKGPPTLAYH